MVRVCLDVNVWITRYLAAARGRSLDTANGRLVRMAFERRCALGALETVLGHAMLDTIEIVLRRLEVTSPFAEIIRDQIESAVASGRSPLGVLGGTASHAMLDEEDAGVLNVALAGAADLLVTNNLADFVRGARARTDSEVLAHRSGNPDVALLRHLLAPEGILIASPRTAVSWLERVEPLPIGRRWSVGEGTTASR